MHVCTTCATVILALDSLPKNPSDRGCDDEDRKTHDDFSCSDDLQPSRNSILLLRESDTIPPTPGLGLVR